MDSEWPSDDTVDLWGPKLPDPRHYPPRKPVRRPPSLQTRQDGRWLDILDRLCWSGVTRHQLYRFFHEAKVESRPEEVRVTLAPILKDVFVRDHGETLSGICRACGVHVRLVAGA